MPRPVPPSVSSEGSEPPQELLLALVAESAKKSRVCWLSWGGSSDPGDSTDGGTSPGRRAPRLVWHVWYDGALLVVSADDQPLPEIDRAVTARVVMRSKDTGGRLVSWDGAVSTVDPASDAWEEHAAALLGVRLNLPDPAATLAAWRTSATLVRVVPVDTTEGPDTGPLP